MRYVTNESLYSRASTEVDLILKQMTVAMLSSQEALNSSFFGRFLVSVCDTFVGICNSAATNITRITKSLKRSELHEFIDSNKFKVKTVDEIPYSRLVGFKVDIPAKMSGTYKAAIENIANVYVRLNAFNTSRLLQNSLTQIYTSLSNDDKKAAGIINTIYGVVDSIVKASKDVILDCQNRFSAKFQDKSTFDNLFLTKEEWIDSKTMMLELEPRLQEARSIRENIETIETILKNICNFLGSNTENLGQAEVTKFGEMIKHVALVMDGYNLAVTRHMALEHNYVLMINAIYAGVK